MKNTSNNLPAKNHTTVTSNVGAANNNTILYSPNFATSPNTLSSGSGITFPNLSMFRDFAIGFERQWDMLETISTTISKSTYPPYNIIKINNDEYVVEIALAGFSKKEVNITQQEQTLVVSGEKAKKTDTEDETTYVHKGIGARNFKHTFALADYVEVVSAELVDGILTISLKRELPEDKKPRKIAVK